MLKVVMRMTRSQQMALVDILCEHMVNPEATQIFTNCSVDPPTDTTTPELLRLVSDHSEMEEVRHA